jgi:hypothetical protein
MFFGLCLTEKKRPDMLRFALMIGIFAVAQLVDSGAARANEGPWCALRNFSDLSEDYQYRTFEECRVAIVAGIRGFCNPNPRWQGEIARPRPYQRGY